MTKGQRETLSQYLNDQVLHAQNAEYIFYAQYCSEIEQVLSTLSVALRKG